MEPVVEKGTFPDLEAFYEADPARRGSDYLEYGSRWTETGAFLAGLEAGPPSSDGSRWRRLLGRPPAAGTGDVPAIHDEPCWRVFYLRSTAEVCAVQLPGGPVRVLGKFPVDTGGRRGEPFSAGLNRHLSGWGERAGRPDSLEWLVERLAVPPEKKPGEPRHQLNVMVDDLLWDQLDYIAGCEGVAKQAIVRRILAEAMRREFAMPVNTPGDRPRRSEGRPRGRRQPVRHRPG